MAAGGRASREEDEGGGGVIDDGSGRGAGEADGKRERACDNDESGKAVR